MYTVHWHAKQTLAMQREASLAATVEEEVRTGQSRQSQRQSKRKEKKKTAERFEMTHRVLSHDIKKANVT